MFFSNSFTAKLLLVCNKTMTKAEKKNKEMLIQLEVVSKIEELYGIVLSNLQFTVKLVLQKFNL